MLGLSPRITYVACHSHNLGNPYILSMARYHTRSRTYASAKAYGSSDASPQAEPARVWDKRGIGRPHTVFGGRAEPVRGECVMTHRLQRQVAERVGSRTCKRRSRHSRRQLGESRGTAHCRLAVATPKHAIVRPSFRHVCAPTLSCPFREKPNDRMDAANSTRPPLQELPERSKLHGRKVWP